MCRDQLLSLVHFPFLYSNPDKPEEIATKA